MRTKTLFAVAAVVVACTGGASPSQAQPVEHSQYQDHAGGVGDFCGADMPLRWDFSVTGVVTGRVTGGTLRYLSTNHDVETWTNLATGRTLTFTEDGVQQDLSVTNNGDGTLNVIFQGAGHTSATGPDGKFVSVGAGSGRYLLVIDYGGTLLDGSDDTVISQTQLTNHGPTGGNHCDLYRRLTA